MRTKREKTTEEAISGIRRQMRSLEARAAYEDPWVVADMLALRDELDAMAVRTVGRMRGLGIGWDALGYSLGISAEQARKRFAPKIARQRRCPACGTTDDSSHGCTLAQRSLLVVRAPLPEPEGWM